MIFNGLTNDDKDKLRKAITSDNISSQSVASATTVNGHTVNKDVPANAVFTDTNTWRPLGTAADTACAGNDSRLSNSRPASDVYSWAKASSKPSYTASEVGALASGGTAVNSDKVDGYHVSFDSSTGTLSFTS